MTYPIHQHPSPNHSPRGGHSISMLVLHSTVGGIASSLAWLTNPASRVSSHYVIDKAGTIYQLVQDEMAAWHAGRATWHGVTDINAVSLGIEMENANTGHDPYPPPQIAACHWLCQDKIARYNIERGDVVRHLDIAVPRGRKTDPAGFPWPAFADSLYMPDFESYYRVKALATAGATIRAAPRTNAAILGHLHAGDLWTGESIPGQLVTIPGFGSSSQWIRDSTMRCVWSGLLEEIPHRG